MLECGFKKKINSNKMHIVMDLLPIHHYPEYLEDCCTLINKEWPRSRTSRMRSLTSSCDSLPTCLVLVCSKQVLGHSKLSALHSFPRSCFLETGAISSLLPGCPSYLSISRADPE